MMNLLRSAIKLRCALLCLVGTIFVTGCSNDSPVRDIFNQITFFDGLLLSTDSITGKNAEPQRAENKLCPSVTVAPELAFAPQFSDITRIEEENMLAVSHITYLAHRCRTRGDTLTLDIDLQFDAELGEAGLHTKTAPIYSFPYFMAIVGPDASIAAKDVYAIAINFNDHDETATTLHTIHQEINLKDAHDNAKKLHIIIGFQLSLDELSFIRRHLGSDKK